MLSAIRLLCSRISNYLNEIAPTCSTISTRHRRKCLTDWPHAEVGKVTLKSNGDEALSDESLLKK